MSHLGGSQAGGAWQARTRGRGCGGAIELSRDGAVSELLCCQCDGFQCLLLCDSCFQRLAALQEPGRGEWCGRSSGSVPCPSERQALCCGQEAFLWFLWFPVFFGRREEATGADSGAVLRVRQAALGGLQCLAWHGAHSPGCCCGSPGTAATSPVLLPTAPSLSSCAHCAHPVSNGTG